MSKQSVGKRAVGLATTENDRLGVANANDLDHGIPSAIKNYDDGTVQVIKPGRKSIGVGTGTDIQAPSPEELLQQQLEAEAEDDGLNNPHHHHHHHHQDDPNHPHHHHPHQDKPDPAHPHHHPHHHHHQPGQGRTDLGKEGSGIVIVNKSSHVLVDLEPNNNEKIKFHEHEVSVKLKLLEGTPKIYIRPNHNTEKRLDILDETGGVIYQLINFSNTKVDVHEINFCLMDKTGKEELLTMQGDTGCIGMSGEITVRFAGSLPGDDELVYGRVSMATVAGKCCCCCGFRLTCRLEDGQGIDLCDLVDHNHTCLFNPCRTFYPLKFHVVELSSEGDDPKVVGRLLEHRHPIDVDDDQDARTKGVAKYTVPPKKDHKSVNQDDMSSENNHTHFCFVVKDSVQRQTRAVLIAAHILANYQYLGGKTSSRQIFLVIIYALGFTLLLIGILWLITWIHLTL